MKLKDKILKGAEYIENGDPLKDAMDDYEIMDAIAILAEMIKDGAARPFFDD